ncbi:Uu.00g064230.m01.CDS01 [Anthostomella pinea]|uniref:Uu.00g064230.m01.CDS01 n=1 Tax=Anthostomella pinea TaxID=933095 RepID=A0AAI8VUR6_9PEZI|nr:Uu.00g064230.m01.CDS01 [Anthostomella pinea]
MAASESKYSLVGDSESRDSDSESGTFLPRSSYQTGPRRRVWPWILHVISFLISASLFVAAAANYHRSLGPAGFDEPGYTQEYSKAVESVGLRHSWQYYGEFAQPSPWRGQPNADVDAAWENITHAGVFSITREQMERLNKLHNTSVMLPPESGGGYMASLEATHQMHCVDMLRKFSYREYYADKSAPFSDPDKLRTHMDHCIEMLRQVIMCSADLHIITYDWVAHVDTPWPDFSVSRQCRNYDSIMDWIHQRTAMTSAPKGLIIRPEGAAVKHVEPVEYVHEGF